MTVLDERGWPVVVERVGWGRTLPYLASGWAGGEGRFTDGATAAGALRRWQRGTFLPRNVPPGDRRAELRARFAEMVEAEATLSPCRHCGRLVLVGRCCPMAGEE